MIDVVVCQTGMARHDADLLVKVEAAGGRLSTVECFDRCEACERSLLAKIDGMTTRFPNGVELASAVRALAESA